MDIKAINIKSIYVVTLNWNLPEDTAACLRSLFTAGMPYGNVIVVDNASDDDSVERLRAEFGKKPSDQITLIESQANLGFAGGNNLGIAYALSVGAEWIFLLNNDTVVAPTLFSEMLSEMAASTEQEPSFGLFAPLIYYASEPNRIWSLGDRAIGDTLLTRGILRNQFRPATLPSFMEVDSLNACALMIHRSVFQRIGGFDTRYFMYAEDADLCRRARSAEFRMGCCTNAALWHKVSLSTGVHDPRSRYWRTANQIRFYCAHASGGQRVMLFGFTLVRVLRLGVADLLHHRHAAAKATIRAWWDGWFNSS